MARIRLDYVSLNGFLFRHGLADRKHCDSCSAAQGFLVTQSASHHILACPTFVHERQVLLAAVNSALDRFNDHLVSATDLFLPSGTPKVDFAIAEAICAFTTATMDGFM